jgi:hypothetical protein
MDTQIVPGIGDDPRLVVRDPVAHPITESASHDLGIASECLGRRALAPAAAIL